jgi:hypothetical protein
MNTDQPQEIQFMGQKIQLRAPGKDAQSTREVVELVAGLLEGAEKRFDTRLTPMPYQVVLLALLDLAEDYLEAKRKVVEHQQKIEEKTAELLKRFETESA